MKFIIDIQDNLHPLRALKAVARVVKLGRISTTTKGVPHYCWVCLPFLDIEVSVKRKDHANAADSFVVRRAQGERT